MKTKLIAAVTVAAVLLVVPAAGVAGAADSPATAGARGHRLGRALALGTAATAIGVERRDLREALAGGKSVADVARAHDVAPQAVVDAVLHAADEKIDAAVADGKIDAARADTIKDGLDARVARLVDAKLGERARQRLAQRQHRRTVRRHVRRGGLAVAAKTIGVEPKELVAGVRDGQSVADIARAHDVDPQTVIDALVAAATKKIDDAVANGKVAESRAAAAKGKLEDRVTKRVNATRPVRQAK